MRASDLKFRGDKEKEVTTTQNIMDQVEKYRREIIEAQRRLVAMPAMSPVSGGQGEMQKALLVEKWLKEMGMAIERIDAPDDRVPGGHRPNIAATLPGG